MPLSGRHSIFISRHALARALIPKWEYPIRSDKVSVIIKAYVRRHVSQVLKKLQATRMTAVQLCLLLFCYCPARFAFPSWSPFGATIGRKCCCLKAMLAFPRTGITGNLSQASNPSRSIRAGWQIALNCTRPARISISALLSTNIGSLFTKISNLLLVLQSPTPIRNCGICLPESWLKPDITDLLMSIDKSD